MNISGGWNMAVFTFLKEHCLACTQHKEQEGTSSLLFLA